MKKYLFIIILLLLFLMEEFIETLDRILKQCLFYVVYHV